MNPRKPRAPAGALEIGGEVVLPGERRRINLPVARIPPETLLNLPVMVVHGTHPGPRVWINAAIHGDEINGVEIIHRLLQRIEPTRLRGVLVAVPIVNVFGFVHQTRYLPDRRDLNRSFPGSAHGSLASRLAHKFMTEIVKKCDYGIDLHTGSDSRTNLPQLRANLDDPRTLAIAQAFGAPVLIHSRIRDGSLREAAGRRGIPVLIFEGGEADRFTEEATRVGIRGVLGVLRQLGMWQRSASAAPRPSVMIQSSTWLRANRSGILRLKVSLGHETSPGEILGTIADPFGDQADQVTAPHRGIIIGHTVHPVVYAGDALVHLARPRAAKEVVS